MLERIASIIIFKQMSFSSMSVPIVRVVLNYADIENV